MQFSADRRLEDYLLPAVEELDEFSIFDEDMPAPRNEDSVFYSEWP